MMSRQTGWTAEQAIGQTAVISAIFRRRVVTLVDMTTVVVTFVVIAMAVATWSTTPPISATCVRTGSATRSNRRTPTEYLSSDLQVLRECRSLIKQTTYRRVNEQSSWRHTSSLIITSLDHHHDSLEEPSSTLARLLQLVKQTFTARTVGAHLHHVTCATTSYVRLASTAMYRTVCKTVLKHWRQAEVNRLCSTAATELCSMTVISRAKLSKIELCWYIRALRDCYLHVSNGRVFKSHCIAFMCSYSFSV